MSTHYDSNKHDIVFECDFCGAVADKEAAKAQSWHRMTTFNNVRDFCHDCWSEVGDSCQKQAHIGQYVVSGLIQ
jgi:hypothetical protein